MRKLVLAVFMFLGVQWGSYCWATPIVMELTGKAGSNVSAELTLNWDNGALTVDVKNTSLDQTEKIKGIYLNIPTSLVMLSGYTVPNGWTIGLLPDGEKLNAQHGSFDLLLATTGKTRIKSGADRLFTLDLSSYSPPPPALSMMSAASTSSGAEDLTTADFVGALSVTGKNGIPVPDAIVFSGEDGKEIAVDSLPVPEPTSLMLVGVGLIFFGLLQAASRKRKPILLEAAS